MNKDASAENLKKSVAVFVNLFRIEKKRSGRHSKKSSQSFTLLKKRGQLIVTKL